MKLMIVILLGLTAVVSAAIVVSNTVPKKEGYKDIMLSQNLNDYIIQRPSFKAELSPRFDPYRTGGGYIKSSYPPVSQQASGVTPLSDSYDFATLGGIESEVDKYSEACNSNKKDAISSFKASQDYTDAEQLLPTPDMRSCLKNPQDPSNYMYDRTIFSPLKRRNRNNVDFIRGDLRIPPNKFGWFDVPTIPGVDLFAGSLQYISSPVLDNEDTIYFRDKPIVSPIVSSPISESGSPWGMMSTRIP